MGHVVRQIVSGGQTGVDRAALDVAILLQIPHGGWCPAGRVAEDGAIPLHYQLRETTSGKYPSRTKQNILDSDGTLILYRGTIHGGTLLTVQLAERHQRPLFKVDLAEGEDARAAKCAELLGWIATFKIAALNVAGPRESSHAGIGQQARDFMVGAFGNKPTGNGPLSVEYEPS